ncbi:MAG: adenylosuccinate synthetase [Candidatus Eremiobacteraeota bacterium]|nr:adenylosuccinate synthetase [Candidatus Eremiobacteraeota bacterium]
MVRGIIVADLGFGDSGKGTVTDALVRRLGAGLVVRYNGGAQAGHTVVLEDGRFHTFSQLGAGSFVAGVRTYLSRFMVVHPSGLLEEARVLAGKGVSDALERVSIDPRARLITPFHQAANRLREVLRGEDRHGSCGLGVGETMHHSLEHPDEAVVAADLAHPEGLRKKLCRIQQRYWQEFSGQRRQLVSHPLGAAEVAVLESARAAAGFLELAARLTSRVESVVPEGTVILEGAQGVLLDEWRGFHPHTTWSTCTFANGLELVREWGGQSFRLGVVRSYATRHGAGPFPTEDQGLAWPEPHNRWGPWQEGFRLGWLDAMLLGYAVDACGGLDGLAVTHLDRVGPGCKLGLGYRGLAAEFMRGDRLKLGRFTDLDYQERLGRALGAVEPVYASVADAPSLCAALAELVDAPVCLASYGPTPADKRFKPSLSPRHASV